MAVDDLATRWSKNIISHDIDLFCSSKRINDVVIALKLSVFIGKSGCELNNGKWLIS